MTLPLDELLNQSTSFGKVQSIKEVQYGDGYGQRAGDGINNVRASGSISWIPLDVTDRDTVQAFWDAHGVVDSWLWTRPNDIERLWRFTDGMSEANTADRYILSTSIQEVFE